MAVLIVAVLTLFSSVICRQVSHHNVSIADVVESDPMFSDILSLVKQSPAVYEKLLFRSGSSLQVTIEIHNHI